MRPLFWRLDQSRRDRVHPNVLDLAPKVPLVSNCLLMETGLPDFHLVFPPFVNFIGSAAFDELHHLFHSSGWSRREQEMHVVRHEDKLVKEVGAGGPMAEQNLDRYFSVFWHPKQTAIGPSLRRHEVCTTRGGAMLQSTHGPRLRG